MKIALVHYTYLPVVGGVELVMGAHAQILAGAGHEVTIVCRRGTSGDPRIRVDLLPVDREVAPRVEAALARQDVVIIHNVCTMPFDLEFTHALWTSAEKLRRTRFICWLHDLAACRPEFVLPSNARLLTLANPRFEYVVVSEHRQLQFRQRTAISARVIPNGVDVTNVLALPAEVAAFVSRHRLLERDIILLHPARLLARKRIDFSLRVAAALKARNLSCALLITAAADPHTVTAQAHTNELRGLQEELGLNDVAFFVGDHFPVGARDLAALYHLADALIFPSHEEGFGLPVLEAALHRLPIFCTDAPPLNAHLAHGLMLFSPEAGPAEVAEMIVRHISADPPTQARKQTVRNYSWETINRKFLAPLLAETPSSNPP